MDNLGGNFAPGSFVPPTCIDSDVLAMIPLVDTRSGGKATKSCDLRRKTL